MRTPVIDYRMSVCVLAAVDHVKTVDRAARACVIHPDVDVVARKRGAKIYRGRVVAGLRTKTGARHGHMRRSGAFALNFVMLKAGAVTEHQIDNGIG